MGAEAVKKLLEQLDLDQLSSSCVLKLAASSQKKLRIVKRLEVVGPSGSPAISPAG